MTDATSFDMGSTDLGPFFKRYDRRNRLVLGAAISASLVLSAVIATHVLTTGGPGAKFVAIVWGMGVVFPPLGIAGWWTFGELIALGRRRGTPPAGPLPTGADDARNGVRIANAGFAFNLAFVAALITGQALMASLVFGYPVPGVLIARVIMVTEGAVTIYLGNLWPRMPTPRAQGRKAAIMMKANRISGWVMVIFGLLVVLLGLFLPLLHPGHRP
jgi:hypothetical protein